jgi:hypothetical protein
MTYHRNQAALVQNTNLLLTVDSGTYLTTVLNLVPSYWDDQDRTLLSMFSNLVGILHDVGQLETQRRGSGTPSPKNG